MDNQKKMNWFMAVAYILTVAGYITIWLSLKVPSIYSFLEGAPLVCLIVLLFVGIFGVGGWALKQIW